MTKIKQDFDSDETLIMEIKKKYTKHSSAPEIAIDMLIESYRKKGTIKENFDGTVSVKAQKDSPWVNYENMGDLRTALRERVEGIGINESSTIVSSNELRNDFYVLYDRFNEMTETLHEYVIKGMPEENKEEMYEMCLETEKCLSEIVKVLSNLVYREFGFPETLDSFSEETFFMHLDRVFLEFFGEADIKGSDDIDSGLVTDIKKPVAVVVFCQLNRMSKSINFSLDERARLAEICDKLRNYELYKFNDGSTIESMLRETKAPRTDTDDFYEEKQE
jgi:hypothetical protein